MAQNLTNLPIGAKVKFGKHTVSGETPQDIVWLVVAKQHYTTTSVTLLAEKVIDKLPFDAIEPTNPTSVIKSYGNGKYSISNIKQWLNSKATSWYSSQHEYDAVDTTMGSRVGFLHHFTDAEYNAILTTSVKAGVTESGSTSYYTVNEKVFLPSYMELGLLSPTSTKDTNYGTAWGFPNTTERLSGYITQQLVAYSPENLDATTPVTYMTRTMHNSKGEIAVVSGTKNPNTATSIGPAKSSWGVRPALNLSATLSISDTTDSDGCYTFIFNAAPPVPTTLNVPTVYGGKATVISWNKVTDPDGNVVTYQLESSINGGEYKTIYTGSNLAFTTTVAFGSTNVQFRLKAVDSYGASSGYITSTSRTVINNNAPVISGSDSNLGTKSSGFSQTYTVEDAESNTVTVKEVIDGVQVRSYVVTLGATNTFSVTGNTWLTLANGVHTLTITATDGVDTSVRTYNFTKSVNSFTIQTATPMAASTRPTRIKVSVLKTIPPEATFKVEVCNNGYDSQPVWEDATSSMNNNLVHLFTNTTKTATNWGVLIRVTVNRNGGSGACYVSSIGGNFE